MIKEFRLPDLGEGLTESEIVSWKVGVGDTVSLNQVIAEVETAKAVVELPSPFAGVITALHEQPGTVVEVGKPIVSFEVPDDAGASPQRGQLRLPRRGHRQTGTEPRGVRRRRRKFRPSGRRQRNFATWRLSRRNQPAAPRWLSLSKPSLPKPARQPETRPFERPRSTPPVRKLAKDLGVDLAAVPGTGASGLITRDDVRNFVGGGDVPAAARHLSAVSEAPAGRPYRGAGRAGNPYAHQGRPEVHGGGDGGKRVYRTACRRSSSRWMSPPPWTCSPG